MGETKALYTARFCRQAATLCNRVRDFLTEDILTHAAEFLEGHDEAVEQARQAGYRQGLEKAAEVAVNLIPMRGATPGTVANAIRSLKDTTHE